MRVYFCDLETHLALAEARLDDASRWIREGGGESDAVHDGRSRAAFHVTASDLAWARGSVQQQREEAEAALALARELGAQEELALALFAMARVHLEAGEEALGVTSLREAAELVEQQGYAEPGPLPLAHLALLGEIPAEQVEIGEACPVVVRAEAHLVLHLAVGGKRHLAVARQLCEQLSAHLDDADRQRFWGIHPIARAVVDEQRNETL